MQPTHARAAGHAGFTLFEVAIALLIAGLVIASALAIFPSGIKVQQLARYRLLATVKAYQLIDTFNTAGNNNNSIDIEAPNAWDVPSSYGNLVDDFEAKMSTRGFGICPLPTAIARRLDSDDDEIQRVLDGGAQLYYCAVSDQIEQDAQKLVFAVDGYAQLNAIAQFHLKRWPYYVPYPSPPQVVQHDLPVSSSLPAVELPGTGPWPASGVQFGLGVNDPSLTHGRNILWDAYAHQNDDPGFASDVQKAFCWNESGVVYGSFPYTETVMKDPATMLQLAERAFQGALWFARKSGLPTTACEDIAAPMTAFDAGACPHWRQVLAMRYLSFAATCLTRWKTAAELGGAYTIPSVTIQGVSTDDAVITLDKIGWWHESCLDLVDLLAATDPYDWGAPRPAERPMMMDMPLLQWDLFSKPDTGTISGSSVTAAQWKPLSARPIANLGCSWSYPAAAPTNAFSAADDHFSLTAAFDAAERCRQLVFWSVDWQSYVDCETAPSAAVDASRWPKAAPWSGASYGNTLTALDWISAHQVSYRNPELYTILLRSMDGADGIPGTTDDVATGTPLTPGTDVFDPSNVWSANDKDPRIFAGLYGADRNGNHHLDRGPIGASTRLYARTVARVNFYDPRLCLVLR